MTQPLRSKEYREFTRDLLTGEERLLDASSEHDVLSGGGAIGSTGGREICFRDCGCHAPVGGRCGVCGAIDCVRCFGRCGRCAKPLCLRHSVLPEKAGIRLCRPCHDLRVFKQRTAKCVHLLTSFFGGK